jgi:hypothetical protein
MNLNASLNISNLEFSTIYQDGIVLDGGGSLTLSFSKFTNVRRKSIYFKQMFKSDIKSCTFSYDKKLYAYQGSYLFTNGICVESIGIFPSFKVQNSTFKADFTGAAVDYAFTFINFTNGGGSFAPGSGGLIEIKSSNSFFFTNVRKISKGIYFGNSNFSDLNLAIDIKNNDFYVNAQLPSQTDYKVVMVEFNGGSKSNVNIRDNTFDGTPNNYPEGVDAAIRFVNCTGTNRYITDNHFPLEIDPPTLYLFFFSYFAAINIYNSDNITICSNEMDNAIVGLSVYGELNNLIFKENAMTKGELIQIIGGHIGESNHFGNQVKPLYFIIGSTAFTVHANPQALCLSGSDPALSPFIVHTDQSTSYNFNNQQWNPFHPLIIDPDVMDEWWAKENGTPSNNCISTVPLLENEQDNFIKNLIATGQISTHISNAVSLYYAESRLLEEVMGNPLMNSTNYANFWASKITTPMYYLLDAKKSFRNLLQMPTSSINIVNSLNANIASLENQVFLIDNMITTATTDIEMQNLSNTKSALSGQIMLQVDSIRSIENAFFLSSITPLMQLSQNVSNINTTSFIDANIKESLLAKIKIFTGQPLSDGEKSSLLMLAQKCDKEAGQGASDAREVIGFCNLDLIESSIMECVPPAIRPQMIESTYSADRGFDGEKHSMDDQGAKIVTDYLEIELNNVSCTEITLFDIFGNQQLSYKDESGISTSIPVSNLSSGLYFGLVKYKDGRHGVIKIVKVSH